MWPDFGEISSSSYEDIVSTRIFGSLPIVTMTFDLLTPKSNQHNYQLKHTQDQHQIQNLYQDTWNG